MPPNPSPRDNDSAVARNVNNDKSGVKESTAQQSQVKSSQRDSLLRIAMATVAICEESLSLDRQWRPPRAPYSAGAVGDDGGEATKAVESGVNGHRDAEGQDAQSAKRDSKMKVTDGARPDRESGKPRRSKNRRRSSQRLSQTVHDINHEVVAARDKTMRGEDDDAGHRDVFGAPSGAQPTKHRPPILNLHNVKSTKTAPAPTMLQATSNARPISRSPPTRTLQGIENRSITSWKSPTGARPQETRRAFLHLRRGLSLHRMPLAQTGAVESRGELAAESGAPSQAMPRPATSQRGSISDVAVRVCSGTTPVR